MEKRHQLHWFWLLIGKNGGLAKHTFEYKLMVQTPLFWDTRSLDFGVLINIILMKIFDHFWWFLPFSMWKWLKLMKIFDHFLIIIFDANLMIFWLIIFDDFQIIFDDFWWKYLINFWWKYLIIFDDFSMLACENDENWWKYLIIFWSANLRFVMKIFDHFLISQFEFLWNLMILMKFDDFDEWNLMKNDGVMIFVFLTVGLMLKWPLFCPKMGRFLRSCFTRNTQPKMTKIGHFL